MKVRFDLASRFLSRALSREFSRLPQIESLLAG